MVSQEVTGKLKIPKCKDMQNTKRKLLVQETVEVRRTEEGFAGSWHPATIIGSCDFARQIKYDHLLEDDESSKEITEWIKVSPSIEGFPQKGQNFITYRGLIRPIPPLIQNLCQSGFHYGLCVDALVNNAWWEGVIFDYEHDNPKRLIFFPDLGDQKMVKIDDIRITRDWDEVNDIWEDRGNWVFLELIEDYEKAWPIVVSVKQIWYELREKEGFRNRIKEWFCNVKHLWKDLVLDTIHQNLELTAENVLNTIMSDKKVNLDVQPIKKARSKRSNLRKARVLSSSGVVLGNSILEHEEGLSLFKWKRRKTEDSSEVVNRSPCDNETIQIQDFDSNQRIDDAWEEREELLESTQSNGCRDDPKFDGIDKYDVSTPNICDLANGKGKRKSNISSRENKVQGCGIVEDKRRRDRSEDHLKRSHRLWKNVHHEAKYLPEALGNYLSNKDLKNDLKVEARKHLSYLNWKIEYVRDTMPRYRYISPEGKTYYSLLIVCELVTKQGILMHSNSNPPSVPSLKTLEQDKDRGSSDDLEPSDSGISEREVQPLVPFNEKLVVQPEDCLQALVKFYEFQTGKEYDKSETMNLLREKAREYLTTLGWEVIKNQGQYNYTSPYKKRCYSLPRACETCMEEVGYCRSTGVMKTASSFIGLKFYSAVMCTKVDKCYTELSSLSSESKEIHEVSNMQENIDKSQLKKRKTGPVPLQSKTQDRNNLQTRQNGEATKVKKRKISGSQPDSRGPTCVLRSKKRVRQVVVPTLAHRTPRTVLSWLIENDVILPRGKVRYSRKQEDCPMKEGRITRVGIKCNCCQKIHTLSSFGTHAGSNYGHPSARIFFEDGRSLLDCQKQLVETTSKGLAPESSVKTKSSSADSDYICSVCHYGGKLLLCEQCPSAFHLCCLGLEDVPEGNWFCPSCRCGICGKNELVGGHEQKRLICCDQCNREYHMGCIREKGLANRDHSLGQNWFCSNKCEKIFVGLRKLLGKSIPVGVNNLSWTILKSSKDDFGESDIEAITEHQSKLNVALAVMHECFEPIKEQGTKRDLVKDVLFNNRSELNRLNFRGFYTVILERGDELISVATVRMHGEKVAEVPLVGTCVQYRRQGMCRILFDVLEKKLRELGVERLLLPAIPQVLHTWTTSFGFSKMTSSERLEFLQYTFLDFQDTTMCQKFL